MAKKTKTAEILAVRMVAIGLVHESQMNCLNHGPENLDAIEASLRRFGQVEPLTVRAKNSGTYELIGGHGRLLVMRDRLGWQEVQAVILDVTEVEAAALGVALNRTGQLGEWNVEKLADVMKSIRFRVDDEDDLAVATGFTVDQVDRLLSSIACGPEDTVARLVSASPDESDSYVPPESSSFGPTTYAASPERHAPLPSSAPEEERKAKVKAVQLYLTADQLHEFERMIGGLMAYYRVDDMPSVVMAALKDSCNRRAG